MITKHDKWGNVTYIESPNGNIDEFIYNERGQLTHHKTNYGFDQRITNGRKTISIVTQHEDGTIIREKLNPYTGEVITFRKEEPSYGI